MKLIVCHGGLKRKIDGEFSLCISAKDLDDLIKKFTDASAAMKLRSIESGWVDIREPLQREHEPVGWHDYTGSPGATP